MRGGERLVKKCSLMRGICSRLYHSTEKSKTFSCRCPSSVMVNNRFRSADYLPCQLPLGGSQELKRFWLIPFNEVHSLSLALLGSSLREGAKGTSCQRAAKSRPYWCGGSQGRFALGGYFSFKMNFITFRAQRWASAFVTPSGLFREATSVRSWISPGMSTSTWARMR